MPAGSSRTRGAPADPDRDPDRDRAAVVSSLASVGDVARQALSAISPARLADEFHGTPQDELGRKDPAARRGQACPGQRAFVSAGARAAAIPFVLVTVFLDVLGIGLIIPVLPALVGEFTADPQHQAYWYGALIAGYGLMQFFAAPLLGALSDRIGRRPVLLLSVVGLGLHFLVIGFAGSLGVLLAARLLGGATAATVSVANAYIADVTPSDQRGRGFGLVGATFGLGLIVGPVAGGVLGDIDLRLPFLAAAAFALLNAGYGLFVLPESMPKERRVGFAWARANPFSALGELAAVREVRGHVLVFSLLALAQFILHATWVLVTSARFGWGPRDAGLSLFAVGVGSVLMQGVLLGRLIHRFGERRVAIAGMTSGVFAFLAYGLLPQGWMMYPVILANLLGFAAMPALQALISRGFDASRQGLTLGSLNAITGVMTVVAPVLGTAIFAQVAHLPAGDLRLSVTFFVGAVLQAIAAAIAWSQRDARGDATSGAE